MQFESVDCCVAMQYAASMQYESLDCCECNLKFWFSMHGNIYEILIENCNLHKQ